MQLFNTVSGTEQSFASVRVNMPTPTFETRHSASRRALRIVSNGQTTLDQFSSTEGPDPIYKPSYKTTPTGRVLRSNSGQSTSVASTDASVRRQLSKSHGNLSQLRPKSPPFYNMIADKCGVNLSPNYFMEDERNRFEPSCDHQKNQATSKDMEASRLDNTMSSYKSPKTSTIFPSCVNAPNAGAVPPVITIQGLSSGFLQPLDFCIPYVRPHPSYENQYKKTVPSNTVHGSFVEHLDTSTTWNGLQLAEAEELFRIHQAFTGTLEQMLAKELWQIYLQSQQQASNGATGLSHPLYTVGVVRGISFCRDQLVGEMADALYSSEEDMAKARMGLFPLYLAANDCLVKYCRDESRDTSITVRVYCEPNSSEPCPIVEAAWVPDTILFRNLGDSLHEGEDFSIIPQYQSNSAFGAARPPSKISYIISSPHHPLSWLTWDNKIAGFKGIVPMFSRISQTEEYLEGVVRSRHENPHTAVDTLRIEVKAILVDDNGSVMRYERVVRARITYKIIPCYAMPTPSDLFPKSTQPNGHQHIESAANRKPLQHSNPEYNPLWLGNFFHDPYLEDYISAKSLSPPSLGTQAINSAGLAPCAAPLPIATSAVDARQLSSLAQRYAALAAKYTDLMQRYADAEKHGRLFSFRNGFGCAQMHKPDSQVIFSRSTGFVNRLRARPRYTGESPVSSSSSGHIAELNAGRPSPRQHADYTSEGQRLGPGNTAGYLALSPPATDLLPSQTFDHNAQAWERVCTPQGAAISQDQAPATRITESQSETSLSASQQGRQTRRLNPSESSQLSPKPVRGDGTPISQEARRSLMTNEGDKRTTTYESRTAQNRHTSPGFYKDVEGTKDRHFGEHMAISGSKVINDLPLPGPLIDTSCAVSKTTVSTQCDSRSTSSELEIITEDDPPMRKVSRLEQAALWASHSSTRNRDKRSPDDTEDLGIARPLLEDSDNVRHYPTGKKRQGTVLVQSIQRQLPGPANQAMSSANLSQSEAIERRNENHSRVAEPKMGKEEQQAMTEAFARSLEDLVGGFEEIFVGVSADSHSISSSEDDNEVAPKDTDK